VTSAAAIRAPARSLRIGISRRRQLPQAARWGARQLRLRSPELPLLSL